jgi:Na+/proline symporter
MKLLNKFLLLTVTFMLSTMSASAQDGMEEYFYQSGKIQVVVVVATIVLVGFFAYLFILENRLRKLEKKN